MPRRLEDIAYELALELRPRFTEERALRELKEFQRSMGWLDASLKQRAAEMAMSKKQARRDIERLQKVRDRWLRRDNRNRRNGYATLRYTEAIGVLQKVLEWQDWGKFDQIANASVSQAATRVPTTHGRKRFLALASLYYEAATGKRTSLMEAYRRHMKQKPGRAPNQKS